MPTAIDDVRDRLGQRIDWLEVVFWAMHNLTRSVQVRLQDSTQQKRPCFIFDGDIVVWITTPDGLPEFSQEAFRILKELRGPQLTESE